MDAPTREPNPEAMRLADDAARKQNWKRFGPYLAERQWGTVRERITRPAATRGTTSRTTTHAAGPTAGINTDYMTINPKLVLGI